MSTGMATMDTEFSAASGLAPLLRLSAWFSPAFPTGGFAYSAGLETAVWRGLVHDEPSLLAWLDGLLTQGGPRNDAILIAAAWGAAARGEALAGLCEFAIALAPSAERCAETRAQGRSFLEAAAYWLPERDLAEAMPDPALPVAIGAVSHRAGVAAEPAIAMFLQAFASGQLQAAIRLSVIGQRGAARLLAQLEQRLAETTARAARGTLEDLGAFSFMADIASMQHETQETRLFLS